MPEPGGMLAEFDGPVFPLSSDEQAMRAIANPTKPKRGVNAFTIRLMRGARSGDRRNDATGRCLSLARRAEVGGDELFAPGDADHQHRLALCATDEDHAVRAGRHGYVVERR